MVLRLDPTIHRRLSKITTGCNRRRINDHRSRIDSTRSRRTEEDKRLLPCQAAFANRHARARNVTTFDTFGCGMIRREKKERERGSVGGPTVICIPASMTSRKSKKKRDRDDGTYIRPPPLPPPSRGPAQRSRDVCPFPVSLGGETPEKERLLFFTKDGVYARFAAPS